MDPFERIPVGDHGVEVTRLGMGGVFIAGRGPADGSSEAPAYETALATIAKVPLCIRPILVSSYTILYSLV